MSSIPQPTLQQQSSLLQQGWGFIQQPGDLSNNRFSLCRVWRGYIMTAYRSDSSNNQIYFHFCDPYMPPGDDWCNGSPSIPNVTTLTSVAAYYSNLSVYLFFTMRSGLLPPYLACVWANQPAAIPIQNNQSWDFTSVQFSAPVFFNNVSPISGPSVAFFGGYLYFAVMASSANAILVYRSSPPSTAGPSAPDINLSLVGAPISDMLENSETTLLSFQDQLLCFYVNEWQQLAYVRVDTTGNKVQPIISPDGLMATDAPPGVTVDATGTLLILCYKKPGTDGEIMVSWSADLNTWAVPVDTGQQTSMGPTLLGSDSGQILMAYRSGSGNNEDTRMFTSNPVKYWYLPNGMNAIPA